MVGRYLSISTLRCHNPEEEDIHYTHDRVRDCRRRYRRCSACVSQIAVFTISPVGIIKQINQTSETEERLMWKRMGVDVGGLLLPPSPGVLAVARGGGFNSDNGDLIGGSRGGDGGGFAMGMGPRRSSSAGLMSTRSSPGTPRFNPSTSTVSSPSLSLSASTAGSSTSTLTSASLASETRPTSIMVGKSSPSPPSSERERDAEVEEAAE